MEFNKRQLAEARKLLATCSDEELYDIFQEMLVVMRNTLDKRNPPVERFVTPVYDKPYVFNQRFRD